MKKLLVLGTLLMSAPFISFAETPTTTVPTIEAIKPGLLPGDFFYFLDQWGESLSLALTFNKENKARKHIEYAKERVSEISEVLKKPGAKIEDVTSAKENFGTQISDAATLVKAEKDNGSDIGGLARELDDELGVFKDELKDIFKGYKDNVGRVEDTMRAKLASLSSDNPEVQGLTEVLQSVTEEKGNAMQEEDGLDAGFMDEHALFEEVMGKEMSAQKHLGEAMRLKARLGAMADQIPAEVAASSQGLLNQAEAANTRGDFEMAKKLSKQAKKMLEKARDMAEDAGTTEPQEVSDSDVTDLEKEIKKSEKAMEGFNNR
ncbi:MAG: hypothetical protein HZB11_02590 [Candidatus Yonathbacteria bacterium]|nr:hypothetical protein [Candidatus Yonathbacteria bacterium]